ncbi:glycosyltransferase family 4 protein [Oryzomonas sagensis]|uniref:Glycosyltransferase family 4 protein n=2 Tax=Oryzomonas sagensis TaxID=2603857 RepID=A0ABQ6TPS3_9BACT|nr:glycosyltransferase family 4 protein [Oryzomonas sagensis]
MNVLFQSRQTLFTVPGGDTIQLLKTKEYLERAGVRVGISTELEPDVAPYDVVHLFNLTRPQEIYLQALNAKKQHKKVVLSTIYMSYAEYDRHARRGMLGLLANALSWGQMEYLKIMARAVKNSEITKGTGHILLKGYRPLLESILDMVDVLLPNSESERKRLMKDFSKAGAKNHVIVPNSVDIGLFDPGTATVAREIEPYRGCILCVARIEGRKCQLDLVRAAKELPWPLVLVGKPAPNHGAYFEQIKREAGPNVHVIGEVDHNLLPHYYKAAKVHALVSWMETTGLSSLEAGAMGCNLVITNKGDTRDYFRDYAFYCAPDSVGSIRLALAKAYEAPVDPALRKHILANFTWEKTAEKTLEGYKMALGIKEGLS